MAASSVGIPDVGLSEGHFSKSARRGAPGRMKPTRLSNQAEERIDGVVVEIKVKIPALSQKARQGRAPSEVDMK